MIDGYYYKTLSMDDWLDENSDLNRLIHEGLVKIVQQTSFYGGQKIWLLIYLPKDLGFLDSWKIGFNWERTTADATAAKTIPDEIKEVPFSHSETADDIEALAKATEESWKRADDMSRTIQRFAVAGIAVYVVFTFGPTLAKVIKAKTAEQKRRQA